jgi:SAM-dependent methyltransferase
MANSPSSGANAEQIAYWNEAAGARWVATQQRIDAVFADVTTTALDVAGPQPGESALDVGCGCGATVLELAHRVGSGGNVVGVDVSRPMLDLAAERVRDEGLNNVTLHLADASTHPFEKAKFDLAFSRFGVMFFDEPVNAFANIRRSLRPGGRLTFLAWRAMSENPWFGIPLAAALRHIPPPDAHDPDAPGPFSFADGNRVRGILENAGFSAIDIRSHDAMMKLGGPNELAEAADLATKIGPVSRALAGQDETAQAAAKAAILEALGKHEVPEGIILPAGVWLASAQA